MSVIAKIPDNSRVRYPVAIFESAVLDGFGRYVWADVVSPLMDDLIPASLYLVERIAFFANAAESDWLTSQITEVEFPRVTLGLRDFPGAIYGNPFRAVNYQDNAEQLLYFRSPQAGDLLQATMEGSVQQVPGMVGNLTLRAQVNFTVYEITDNRWIETFSRDPQSLGNTLRV